MQHTKCLESLTERGHEIEQVLEAWREGALLVLLQAEVERGVDDEAQLGDHLKERKRAETGSVNGGRILGQKRQCWGD